MYTLFVSHLAEEQTAGSFVMERERFLEYTEDRIIGLLHGLSNEAIDCICSWPCLLMQEGRADEVARLVEVAQIRATTKEITVTIRPLRGSFEISNNALWKLRTDLDLEQFEFSRNHWAVKERDIFEILKKSGVSIGAMQEQFKPKPLPVVTRSDLIGVRDAIAARGHPDIDALILEAGVGALNAGRELGGRKARADAIVRFALENPEAITAENSLFSHFLLGQMAADTKSKTGAEKGTPVSLSNVSPPVPLESGSRSPNRVFVVHGRNEQARDEVVSYLDRVGMEGIVLHDQPNMGRHLLTKFIGEAKLVTFAVVLMTDDDVGSAKGGTQAPRARQNVILELGYFLAHLGQAKVCALITPGLETPSDFDGIVYIKMAEDQKWKAELLRELYAAKMPVRMDRLGQS